MLREPVGAAGGRQSAEQPLYRAIAPLKEPAMKGEVPEALVAAVRGRRMPAEELEKRSLGAIAGRWKRLAEVSATQADYGPSAVVLGLCRLCVARGLPPLTLGYSTTKGYEGDWHGPCLGEWRQSPAMRQWVSDRRRGLVYAMPLPPEPPTAHNLVLLKRDLRFAVLNRLRDRGVAGGRSQPELGREAGISHVQVLHGMRKIARLLPSEDKVPERFRPLIRLLAE
jgi:hypothetical protein